MADLVSNQSRNHRFTSGTAKEAVRKREEETKTVDGNGPFSVHSIYGFNQLNDLIS